MQSASRNITVCKTMHETNANDQTKKPMNNKGHTKCSHKQGFAIKLLQNNRKHAIICTKPPKRSQAKRNQAAPHPHPTFSIK